MMTLRLPIEGRAVIGTGFLDVFRAGGAAARPAIRLD
jgi:hypothetical protein